MSAEISRRSLLRLQERLREDYLATGWRVISIDAIVQSGFGTEEEVVAGLMALSRESMVDAYAEVRCANLHTVFGGPLDSIKAELGRRCRCGEDCSEEDVAVLFRISDDWAEVLGPGGQKKTAPQSHVS